MSVHLNGDSVLPTSALGVPSIAVFPSFCVVLPMYNEADSARSCVRGIAEFLASVKSRTGIIAVNDGSTDGTADVLHDLQRMVAGLIVETHATNGGYGSANRTGFAAAIREGFEYALVMDADCTQDPKYIAGFFQPMCESIDFIKASRYARAGKVVGVDWRRLIVSWVGNRLAQWMFGLSLTDYTNGFRAIRTGILRRMQSHETGFAVLIEEVYLARRLGATFAEVPYTLTVRPTMNSKSKFVYSWNVYRSYLKYLFKRV